MTTVVISQPMFFPWVGMFEQIRLADVYVHYDDVQFSKGSFSNRVQVKTDTGSQWLSIPLPGLRLGQRINEVNIDSGVAWRDKHLALLEQAYRRAPCREEMLALVRSVYAQSTHTLDELAIASMDAVLSYFKLTPRTAFHRSSTLGLPGASDDRVLTVVKHFGGSRYVTGHGARNYLDHTMFEQAGVEVLYLDYQKTPYGQLHGPFTPYVSVLDLIANEGPSGSRYIASPAVHWRQFIA